MYIQRSDYVIAACVRASTEFVYEADELKGDEAQTNAIQLLAVVVSCHVLLST